MRSGGNWYTNRPCSTKGKRAGAAPEGRAVVDHWAGSSGACQNLARGRRAAEHLGLPSFILAIEVLQTGYWLSECALKRFSSRRYLRAQRSASVMPSMCTLSPPRAGHCGCCSTLLQPLLHHARLDHVSTQGHILQPQRSRADIISYCVQ